MEFTNGQLKEILSQHQQWLVSEVGWYVPASTAKEANDLCNELNERDKREKGFRIYPFNDCECE